MYTCPVCGYDLLEELPINNTICDCCGTEFGYSDFSMSHKELRDIWIASGKHWWGADFPPPPKWDADKQLDKFDVT